ncbi:MAG: GNAT family N-acetyltransferase [Chitinophagaceae bacterium]|nr:GNAT family N-acetyltransferase [Chitinophagaceae bacterium]
MSEPIFSHVEPIFPVRDIPETIRYWQETLGFTHQWTWGDPPSVGGVAWQKAFVQFMRHPVLAEASKGNAIWIRLRHVEDLYIFHQSRNAEIVAPLEVHEYGMAQYTVRELNGYYVHFAGNPAGRGEGTRDGGHERVIIVARKPTVMEYSQVQGALGGQTERPEIAANIISTAAFGVVAEDAVSGEVVGCAFLLTDHAGFYYVKNVMVRTDRQGSGIGSALMRALMEWLERNVTMPSLVGLFARESLEPFYQQFGFLPSFGMVKEIGEGPGD